MIIKKRRELAHQMVFLTIFGIAMGFLESGVIIYARWLYYPEGFSFPLKPLDIYSISIEYVREISTIIMLFSISSIAGKRFPEKLSFFLYSFGVWDIFYYVWLKVILNWPVSFFTWDILFFIPTIWVGPVLAPIICSITMIAIAVCILYFDRKGYPVKISSYEWVLSLLGTFIIFITFVWDYSRIIFEVGFLSSILTLGTNPAFQQRVVIYIPTEYNWYLFFLGEALILSALILFWKRMKSCQMNDTALNVK